MLQGLTDEIIYKVVCHIDHVKSNMAVNSNIKKMFKQLYAVNYVMLTMIQDSENVFPDLMGIRKTLKEGKD